MKYHDIEPMCKPRGNLRGCPHDGLGCTGGDKCSINSKDHDTQQRAWAADKFGQDFICQKREFAKQKKEGA